MSKTTTTAPGKGNKAATTKTVGGTNPAPVTATTTDGNAGTTEKKKPGNPGLGLMRTEYNKATATMFQLGADGTIDTDEAGKPVVVSAVISDQTNPNNGKLIGVPNNYDYSKNKALTADDFADEVQFLLFKACVADVWAKRYQDSAESYRKQAKNVQKGGKPEDRKRLNKLDKMRKDYAAMREALHAEGLISDEEYQAELVEASKPVAVPVAAAPAAAAEAVAA